ncbi:MAG: acyl-CoA reductase [Candidatus Zixiibacteriota bacterium]|nr:MAG: acyl-CoA reductase [candidate division Zixibacteria bacterium]
MQYELIIPDEADVDSLCGQKILPPFSDVTLAFVEAVSSRILKDASFRQFPEIMAAAFWMRKANMVRLKTTFEKQRGNRLWIGRGLVFHIAPANVDTLFLYSWFLSMLVGNTNIARLSRTSNPQIDSLLVVISHVINQEEFSEICSRNMIVRYDHDEMTTSFFSDRCNMRVIWGGDETIRRIRAIPIPARAIELTFADRFSFSLIRAEAFLSSDSKEALVNDIYNDAYWFEQNACSSPRLVVWLGDADAVERTRTLFWRMFEALVVEKQPPCAPSTAADKLNTECSVVIASRGKPVIEKTDSSRLNRVLLNDSRDINRDVHRGGGMFYEYTISNLEELAELIAPKDQTIGVFGFEHGELKELFANSLPHGVDRIVPIGQALNFSNVWDGHDLLREFCREIEITA